MADQFKKPSLITRRLILGTTVGGALLFFIGGIIFWGGFNTAMEATNNLDFCISCHEMEVNVYEEYKPTIHYSNRTGVRATCPDCHVPDPWIHKMVRKIQASNEVFHKLLGTVDTPEKFDAHRLTMAKRVWTAMKQTDSRECRNCHNFESMNPEFQRPRARNQHMNAFETGQTCIDCHKGIAHKSVRKLLSDEELEQLEAPNPAFAREIPAMFLEGLKRVEAKEAELAAAEQAATDKAREVKIAAEQAEQERIEKAVADALAAYKTGQTGAITAATGAPSSDGIDVDWSKASSREITLFYPGETSMEWVMTGKDHGGSRPFLKGGDRCVTCHDKEVADMGKKMVTGQKAESSPIPGKRASIPVTVESTHDNENLYLRFIWPDGEHAPVPFVEGGKMDPDNPMKLAVMFATDAVEYADRSGCWGTCHHDIRTMPHTPDNDTLNASPVAQQLDVTQGLTKYIKESRSKIEVKGRRGKKRGGWDKLKSADEIKAEMDAHKFIDIIRFKSGNGEVEDGHILEQRLMSGGSGALINAQLDRGMWNLVMKRKLQPNTPGDLPIEQGKLYNFGFAIHDDYSNARFHHVSLGYKLGLDSDQAEVNARAQ